MGIGKLKSICEGHILPSLYAAKLATNLAQRQNTTCMLMGKHKNIKISLNNIYFLSSTDISSNTIERCEKSIVSTT